MSKLRKNGYTLSLHQADTDPELGFGYSEEDARTAFGEIGLLAVVEVWNSYTQETCPHVEFLRGSKCQLCGNKYVLSRVLDDGFELVTQENVKEAVLKIEIAPMKATLVETYQWCHAKLRGFALEKEGVKLPGMITLELENLEKSIDAEIARYLTQYYWDSKPSDREQEIPNSGPWAEFDVELTRAALHQAVLDLHEQI